MVTGRTKINIITGLLVQGLNTARSRVTGIGSTDISIIAIDGRTKHTDAFLAMVCFCTGVAIITWFRVRQEGTAVQRVTKVICAGISILTVHSHPRLTATLIASIAHGTKITVITGEVLVCRNQKTISGLGVADSGLTDGIQSRFGLGASNHCRRVHFTLVGQVIRITIDQSIADISVIENQTILVRKTLTADLIPPTDTFTADIVDRAGVIVLTGRGVELTCTTAQPIAKVVRTGIVVITDNCLPDTDTLLTMVTDGTGITVKTLALTQVLVNAASFRVAAIQGTRIAIITNRRSGLLVNFVNEIVAVIISPIANFGCRLQGVTLSQPLRRTHPLP